MDKMVAEVSRYPYLNIEEYRIKVFLAFKDTGDNLYKMSTATDAEIFNIGCDVVLLLNESFREEARDEIRALIYHCLLKINPYYSGGGNPAIKIDRESIGLDSRVLDVCGRVGIYESQILTAKSPSADKKKSVEIAESARKLGRMDGGRV